jgi:hypothetical protein
VALGESKELMVVCTGYDWSKGVHGLSGINYSPGIVVTIIDRSYLKNK